MPQFPDSPRIVLVTGIPRSGTTAVGRVLAMGGTACALHEPFNRDVGLREIERYFEIPGTAGFSVEVLGRRVDSIRRLDLRFKSGVFPDDRGVRRLIKRVVGGRSRASYRKCRLHNHLDTIVWKDPFACFCADVLADKHRIPSVVTVRNPWAVAASFKRMGWRFDIVDVASRAAEAGLVERAGRLAHGRDLDNPTINAAVLWHLIHETLLEMSAGRAIYLANLDDIVEYPLRAYSSLYDKLELSWSEGIARKISEMYESRSERKHPREKRAHDSKRDLRAINLYWQELLGEEEARAVGELAGETWGRIQDACLPLEPSDSSGKGRE